MSPLLTRHCWCQQNAVTPSSQWYSLFAFYSIGQFHMQHTPGYRSSNTFTKISKHGTPFSNQTPVLLFVVFSSSTTAEKSSSLYSIVSSKEAQAINWKNNLYQHHCLYKHATPTVTHYISTSQRPHKWLHYYKTRIGSLSSFLFHSGHLTCVCVFST